MPPPASWLSTSPSPPRLPPAAPATEEEEGSPALFIFFKSLWGRLSARLAPPVCSDQSALSTYRGEGGRGNRPR